MKSNWRNSGNIIVPGRFLEASEIEIPKTKVFGKFLLTKRNKYGRVIAQIESDNLITNLGKDEATDSANSWWTYCKVGTGTAAPAVGDTTLGSQIANTANRTQNSVNASALNLPALSTFVYTFTLGAVVGNVTEIAVGSSPTNTAARALILDNLGNPVAFPVAADEQLQATYIRGHYGPQSDILTTQTLSGTTYGITISCCSVTANWQPFGIQTGFSGAFSISASATLPSFGGNAPSRTNASSSSNLAYTAGTFFRDFSGTWAAGTATGSWRQAEIKLAGLQLNVLYDANLVKTAAMQLILPFRISWS